MRNHKIRRLAITIGGIFILGYSILTIYSSPFGNNSTRFEQIGDAKSACRDVYPYEISFRHIVLYQKDDTLPDRISMLGILRNDKMLDFDVYCLYDAETETLIEHTIQKHEWLH